MIRRRTAAIALAAMVLASTVAGCPRPRAPKAPVGPKLVVLIVIDQLPAWVFEKRRPLFQHGFARLLKEGVYFPRADYPFAYTYTAPGHAALATGAPPSITGIVGNTWYRRDEARNRPSEYDPTALVLYEPGSLPEGTFTTDDGASAKALRAPGLAEALRTATGGTGRSVAMALKARSACFVAGQKPDLVLWFEEPLGGFTTSLAYRTQRPPWVVELARAKPWTRFATATWTPADAGRLARETGIPDDSPGEAGPHGFGTSFPYDLGATKDPAKALLVTPYGDVLLTDLAIAALDGERLGDDAAADLLAISYSSHDFAAHQWGPDSWEQLDLLLKLDAELGRLLTALDAKLGPDGYAVVLTSDHGSTPIVERSPHRGARRVPTSDVKRVAEVAMSKLLGPGEWIAEITALNIYFSAAYDQVADPELREQAAHAAVDAVRLLPGVQDAGRLAPFARGCPPGEAMVPLCASYVPGESGDIYLVPVVGSLITEYKTGTHHDAPSKDNRRVPVIVRKPGIAARTSYGVVSTLSVAATVAELLGVPAPDKAQAPALELVPPALEAAAAANAAAKNSE